MATFEPEQDPNEAFKVKYILHQKISLEKVKPIQEVQCYNCQNFGHIAINCSIVHRCVRCTKTHVRGECSNSTADKPTCCNCGQSGHPANYRGYPAYKDMVARREAGRAKKNTETMKAKQAVTQMSQSLAKPGFSYAQAARNTLPRAAAPQTPLTQTTRNTIPRNYSPSRQQIPNFWWGL